MLEDILSAENMRAAYQRVRQVLTVWEWMNSTPTYARTGLELETSYGKVLIYPPQSVRWRYRSQTGVNVCWAYLP